MSWNTLIRQVHRWLSIIFTVAVIINIIALVRQAQVFWIGLLALVPLILMLLTGLYLFFLPYVVRWRGAGQGDGRGPGPT
ncbi:MAG: hypothetical protein GC145_11345 [Caulobacter sp.]|nr:hypothetical protein [Caulobacter sp.]